MAFDPYFILNKTVDLRPLQKFASIMEVDFVELNRSIFMIDMELLNSTDSEFRFVNSFFDFYYRGDLVDRELCESKTIRELDIRLFSGLPPVQFVYGYLINSFCTFVFRNAKTAGLLFSPIESNVMMNQKLEAFQIGQIGDLSSAIPELKLMITRNL